MRRQKVRLAGSRRRRRWIPFLLCSAALGHSAAESQTKTPQPLSADEMPTRFEPPEVVESEAALRVGQQIQLLVDNHVLADWWQLRRVQYRVRKHAANPILEPDQAWEETARRSAGSFPTAAVYDPQSGSFILWYQIEQETGGNVIGFAQSRDGIHFEKPLLGLVEYGGSKANNVCRVEPYGKPVWGAIHIIQDPRPQPAERRFWAVGLPHWRDGTNRIRRWAGVAYSADGKTWHMAPGGILEGAGGGNPACLWDPKLDRYVLFHRQLYETAGGGRYIVRQESSDLIDWTPRQTVFNPMAGRWPEVESMMIFYHQGIYFGLPQMLENDQRGEVEVHLITSRDGIRWEHPFPDEPFIPRGSPGDFDDMITWFSQAVAQGDWISFYYGGARYAHNARNWRTMPPERRMNKIGLARVPMDRLMGLRADRGGGAFLTRPLLIEGDELLVNADVSDELVVEVLPTTIPLTLYTLRDSEGRVRYHEFEGKPGPFAGFSYEDCQPVVGDSQQHRVTWKGGGLGEFKGQSVRLRFRARHATIFAFQIR